MNRYNKLGYLPSLASLFFLATPGIFASDILQPQDQNSILNENANNNVQFSLFTTEDPLKIPDFASDALIVAHNPDGSDNHAGTAPASATPKKAETDTASTKPKTARDHHSLSAQATNPIANLMQFQIQNTFIPESYESSGYANSFVLQPVIPIKLSKDGFFPFMITRTTLPVLTTPNFDGPVDGTTGLGDMTILALPVHQQKMGSWGAMWGVGLATVIPTATDHRTGSGKFSLGPSAVAILSPSKSVQTGVLAYHIWDVAGDSDRTYVSKTLFQPVFNYHFKELFGQTGWYGGLGDVLWSYDWNAQQLDLPIAVRMGRVFSVGKLPLNVFFEPFYRPVHNGPSGKYGFKLNVTFLFPE